MFSVNTEKFKSLYMYMFKGNRYIFMGDNSVKLLLPPY